MSPSVEWIMAGIAVLAVCAVLLIDLLAEARRRRTEQEWAKRTAPPVDERPAVQRAAERAWRGE